MSAYGSGGKGAADRQIADEIRRAIQEITADLRSMGSATKEATRTTREKEKEEKSKGTFIGNYAASLARRGGRDFGFGLASDVAEFGGDVLGGGSIGFNALRAASNLGIPQARNAFEPIESATQRTIGAFAGPIRAGASVSDEVMQFTFDRYLAEERRAKGFERRVVEASRPYGQAAAQTLGVDAAVWAQSKYEAAADTITGWLARIGAPVR